MSHSKSPDDGVRTLPSLSGAARPAADATDATDHASAVTRAADQTANRGIVPPASLPAPAGYEILEELGRGGMGVVYKARDGRLNRLVALKMILSGPHAGAQEVARFQREAEAAAALQHPNIVQIFEIGDEGGHPYLALELVEGGSLAERLRSTPQPARAAAQLIEVLARAVHHAHQHGVVHRDLKPANILLAVTAPQVPVNPERVASLATLTVDRSLVNAVPKITDFGLAKRISDSAGPTQPGAVVGTPSYMAPEQAGGTHEQTGPATDIYALGAILYELLTGHPPFRAPLPLDTILQVLHADPVAPSRLQPALPRDIETICLKCLQKEPRRRYPSAEALADDLRRFLAGEPIQARPVGHLERLAKWARRRPAQAGLIGVSVAGILVLLIGGFIYQTRLERSNIDLQDALKQAGQEHKRAEAHLEKAMAVVDEMLTHATDDQLANVPEVVQMRRQLLRDSRAYYEWSLKREDRNPLVRQQTARACFRTAGLHLLVGEVPEALASGLEAVALQTKLIADYPDEPKFRFDLSKTHTYLAHAYGLNQQLGKAQEAYEKAIALAEQLKRDRPEVPDYGEALAANLAFLGYFYSYQNAQRAEDYLRQSIAVARPLVHDHPDVAEYQCLLASGHGSLAFVLIGNQRFAEAKEPVREALALLNPADRPAPEKARYYHWALGTAKYAAGVLDFRANRWDRAEANLKEGMSALEQIATRTRAFPLRLQVAMSYPLFGQLYEQTKRSGLAEQMHKKAMDSTAELERDFPTATFLKQFALDRRVFWMVFPTRRGQNLAKTIEEADALAKRSDLSNMSCYNLACIYALASGTKGMQRSEAEEYARRALQLLEKAEKRGFLSRGNVQLLKTDTDLNALRQRQDFRDLLQRVEREGEQSRPQKKK